MWYLIQTILAAGLAIAFIMFFMFVLWQTWRYNEFYKTANEGDQAFIYMIPPDAPVYDEMKMICTIKERKGNQVKIRVHDGEKFKEKTTDIHNLYLG